MEKLHSRTDVSFRIAAQDYVEAQIEVMRKYGSEPTLTPDQFYALVDEVAMVGRKLWIASGGTVTEI